MQLCLRPCRRISAHLARLSMGMKWAVDYCLGAQGAPMVVRQWAKQVRFIGRLDRGA
jgi:hypothetical protein